MKTIHKMAFHPVVAVLMVPADAQILHVGEQFEAVTVWYLTDETRSSTAGRELHLRGTGGRVEDDLHHVGTAMVGPFVWHVFDTEAPAR